MVSLLSNSTTSKLMRNCKSLSTTYEVEGKSTAEYINIIELFPSIHIPNRSVEGCFGKGGLRRACCCFLWFKHVHGRNHFVRLRLKIVGGGGGPQPSETPTPPPLFLHHCKCLVRFLIKLYLLQSMSIYYSIKFLIILLLFQLEIAKLNNDDCSS